MLSKCLVFARYQCFHAKMSDKPYLAPHRGDYMDGWCCLLTITIADDNNSNICNSDDAPMPTMQKKRGECWGPRGGREGGAVLGSRTLPLYLPCTQTSPRLCSAEKVPVSPIDPHLWLLQMKLSCLWLESSMHQTQLSGLHASRSSSSSCHSS